MPCTNVKVTPASLIEASILIGTGFTQIRCHHVKRRVAHGKAKANISNHWGD